MKYAAVGPIAVHLPETVETNDMLRAEFPNWDLDLIFQKTGIRARHIAGKDELASDLGVAAAEKLISGYAIDRRTIDFLLLCTQTPDYPLPTTACMLQDRLRLPTTCGALDFNLGCSGFVYGLALADGLIRTGSCRRILLITAETYSKYIDPGDRSLRTIFGDGAAATLVEASDRPTLSGFRYGTDGSGADMLMLTRSGARSPGCGLKPRKRRRWQSDLYMDGPGLVHFTVEMLPELIQSVLDDAGLKHTDVDRYIAHQPTRLLLDQIRSVLGVDERRLPMVLENYGNTVSSTIPLVIEQLRSRGELEAGRQNLLIGFGVGLSWAACAWRETWDGQRHVR